MSTTIPPTPPTPIGGGARRRRRKRRTDEEICRYQSSRYRSMFPDVRYLSSSEILPRVIRREEEKGGELSAVTGTTGAVGDEKNVGRRRKERSTRRLLVLVDVRTDKEMSVSMIPGAISLREFEERVRTRGGLCDDWTAMEMPPGGTGENSDGGDDGEEFGGGVDVVTYCTIGYRSGMEARRLRRNYERRRAHNHHHHNRPDRHQQAEEACVSRPDGEEVVSAEAEAEDGASVDDDVNFYSLDGIVPYTHARTGGDSTHLAGGGGVGGGMVGTENGGDDDIDGASSPLLETHEPPPLIDPNTGEATNVVHTFSSLWRYVDSDDYETTKFGPVMVAVHGFGVGVRGAVQTLAGAMDRCRCCCPPRPQRFR